MLAGHRRQRRILATAHRHGSRSRQAGAAHGGLQTGVATGCLEYNPGNAYSTLPLILRGRATEDMPGVGYSGYRQCGRAALAATLISCACAACWLTTTLPSSKLRVFFLTGKA